MVVSNGNFHGQPPPLTDTLAMAAELANISERRIERLVNPSLSEGSRPSSRARAASTRVS
jgi:histidine ammonia-lyase